MKQFLFLTFLLGSCASTSQTMVESAPTLTSDQANSLARIALDSIVREFPNKPSEVQASAQDALTPRAMHPAFYGSFDWHSSVHGHWMLIRLMRLGLLSSDLEAEARASLGAHLTADAMAQELAYFELPYQRGFERMYGWAWYLRMCDELDDWEDEDGARWREVCRPLEDFLVGQVFDYLPKLTWPVRAGVHRDTAFALTHIWDYAVQVGHSDLQELIEGRARDWFLADRDWGWRFEPSGQDFLSAGLEEMDLMRRVLSREECLAWMDGFGYPRLTPVEVSDVTDGKIVHLAGLDLSRAWCLESLAAFLGPHHPETPGLLESASAHRDMGLHYVASGHYEGEHWLASFAVYLTTGSGR
ncbi:MAG: DUF2891 domain-containing protein [Planctomycetes bacterium]|nr:DUF2891 domain-containing protein [Planctomycetota bacterium]